jgi:hypothetical protein
MNPTLPSAAARYAGSELTRGDYRRLTAAGLCACNDVIKSDDEVLLPCVDNDKRRLAVLRAAAEKQAQARDS